MEKSYFNCRIGVTEINSRIMNYFKARSVANPKSYTSWWRRLPIGVFLVILGMASLSCEKDEIVPVLDEYYVTYEVRSSTIYGGLKMLVTFNTETNEEMNIYISQGGRWDVVIGPVQRGFNANLKVRATSETHGKLKLYADIHVSKNGSPFALKKADGSDRPREAVELSYTIDY